MQPSDQLFWSSHKLLSMLFESLVAGSEQRDTIEPVLSDGGRLVCALQLTSQPTCLGIVFDKDDQVIARLEVPVCRSFDGNTLDITVREQTPLQRLIANALHGAASPQVVVVNAFPQRTVEKISRDSAGEVVQIEREVVPDSVPTPAPAHEGNSYGNFT
jgi:hypothetical protein